MTGPLYEKDMPSLPGADELHKIPSGYWKIIVVPGKSGNTLEVAAFIFNQDTPRNDKAIDHISTINEIERRNGEILIVYFLEYFEAYKHHKFLIIQLKAHTYKEKGGIVNTPL